MGKKYITLYNRFSEEDFITNFIKRRLGNTSDIIINNNLISAKVKLQAIRFLQNFNNNDISILIGKPGTIKSCYKSSN